MTTDTQRTSDSWLSYTKALTELDGENALTNAELAALVECAEALRDLYDEQNGPPLERRAQQWHNANGRASTALAKLEAL